MLHSNFVHFQPLLTYQMQRKYMTASLHLRFEVINR